MGDKPGDNEAPQTGEPQESNDGEDLASRFPDVETDERLHVPVDLPEPPKVAFQRPDTRAARGEKADPATEDAMNFGRAGRISGNDLRNAGAAATIGWSLVISILVGTGLGALVDRFVLHSQATPWGLIIGLLVGVVTGFVNVMRVANQLNKD